MPSTTRPSSEASDGDAPAAARRLVRGRSARSRRGSSPVGRPRLLPVAVLATLLAVAGCVAPDSPTVEGPAPSTGPDPKVDPPPDGCTGRGEPTTVTEVYRDDVGDVDPNLVSLDLSTPDVAEGCGPVPLVVYVHGGGFSIGDKGNKIADKRRLFTGEGWAFASVNYRLSPSPPNGDPGRVQHPIHVQDVAAAVGWLADEGQARGIDGTRIALMGHSAGAFLVALAATDLSYLGAAGVDPSQLRCAVPLDTRYDPRAEGALSPSAMAMYRNAFGDDTSRWDAASPLRVIRAKAGTPDFLVVTRGTAPRIAASQEFADALVRVRVPVVEVLDASPLDHEGVNAAVGKPGDTVVTPVLMSFLRDCLALEQRRPKG